MKFDKFMEHCFRILCVALACFVLVASIGACFAPVKAHAEDNYIELIYGLPERIQQLYQSGKVQITEVENAIKTDLANGNLDASTELGQHVFTCWYLQNCMFGGGNVGSPNWLLGQGAFSAYDYYYHNYGNDYFEHMPDNIPISATGTYGLYKTSLDNYVHFGNWFLNSENVFQSDVINLTIDTTNSGYTASDMRFRSYVTGTNVLVFNILSPSGYYGNYTIYDTSNYMGRSRATTGTDYYVASLNVNNSIPIISSGVTIDMYSAYGAMTKGAPSISLPENSTLSKEEPWLYYNNTLLPYMRTNYPDVPDKYFVFPTGYTPSVNPNYYNPNVNFNGVGIGGLGGIIAGAGAIINIGGVGSVNVFAPIQGQINIDGIQFQIPLDGDSIFINKLPYSAPNSSIELGDHIIDLVSKTQFLVDGIEYLLNSDGTISIDNVVYNLPIGTPTQLPTDANEFLYEYEIPTVERINIVDADLQAPTLSTFGNAINFIWASVYTVLSSTGLLPLVAISLGLGAVGYVLWKIGG